jgi:hypothetical protein
MLHFGKVLGVASPVHHFLPLFEVIFVIENSSISLNLLSGDLIAESVEFSVLNTIVNILMSDVFPGGVPFVELGIFKVLLMIGFGIDVGVSAGRGVTE